MTPHQAQDMAQGAMANHHEIMQGGVWAMVASAGSGFATWFFGQEATPAVIRVRQPGKFSI